MLEVTVINKDLDINDRHKYKFTNNWVHSIELLFGLMWLDLKTWISSIGACNL